MSERTFVALKPDAIERGLVGAILGRFEDEELRIQRLQTIEASDELLAEHYDEHVSEDYYEGLVEYMQERPILAAEIRGENAVEVVRTLTGATDPDEANPDTIRGEYGIDSFRTADDENRAVRNLVHTAEDREAAKQELDLWFGER